MGHNLDWNEKKILNKYFQMALGGNLFSNTEPFDHLPSQYYEIKYNPLRDNENNILDVTVIAIHITSSIRTENKLARLSDRLG